MARLRHGGRSPSLASVVLALLALRGRLRRTLGAVALGGLWLLSAGAWVLPRRRRRRRRGRLGVVAAPAPRAGLAAWAAIGAAAFVVGIATMGRHAATHALTFVTTEHARDRAERGPQEGRPRRPRTSSTRYEGVAAADDPRSTVDRRRRGLARRRRTRASALDGGIVQGVAPVALPLLAYERSIAITRELVTRDRPLTLHLVYLTTAGVAPLVGPLARLPPRGSCASTPPRSRGSSASSASASRARTSPTPRRPAPAAPPPVVA